MRSFVLTAAVCAVTAACSPTAPAAASKPDARLGAVVHATSDSVFGESQPYLGPTSVGHVLNSRAEMTAGPSGETYTLITLDTGRIFGTDETTPSKTIFKKVVGDTVTTLPAPLLGSEVDPTLSYLRLSGDGQPYNVDTMPADNAHGRFVQVAAFTGTEWKYAAFVRADRAPVDTGDTWNSAEDQVRALDASHLVIQHTNTLARFDGTSWTPVTNPPNAIELRLGTADATHVRVYWTTSDKFLKSDVLNVDGTWAGTVTGIASTDLLTLRGIYGFSGTLDTFVINAGTKTLQVAVYRHQAGAFSLVTTRPPFAAETEGKSYLAALTDPDKAVMVIPQTWTFTSVYKGNVSGQLFMFPGNTLEPQVTCTGNCATGEGMAVATDPACAECVPRTIRVMAWVLSADFKTMSLLLRDREQDQTERYYVKSFAVPSTPAAITDAPMGGPFPGSP